MSLFESASPQVGNVMIGITAPHTGLSPSDLAEMLTDKIVFVGPEVPPAIREQAQAYRERIVQVSRHYLTQAQKSDRTTVIGILEQAGQHDAAELIRKL